MPKPNDFFDYIYSGGLGAFIIYSLLKARLNPFMLPGVNLDEKIFTSPEIHKTAQEIVKDENGFYKWKEDFGDKFNLLQYYTIKVVRYPQVAFTSWWENLDSYDLGRLLFFIQRGVGGGVIIIAGLVVRFLIKDPIQRLNERIIERRAQNLAERQMQRRNAQELFDLLSNLEVLQKPKFDQGKRFNLGSLGEQVIMPDHRVLEKQKTQEAVEEIVEEEKEKEEQKATVEIIIENKETGQTEVYEQKQLEKQLKEYVEVDSNIVEKFVNKQKKDFSNILLLLSKIYKNNPNFVEENSTFFNKIKKLLGALLKQKQSKKLRKIMLGLYNKILKNSLGSTAKELEQSVNSVFSFEEVFSNIIKEYKQILNRCLKERGFKDKNGVKNLLFLYTVFMAKLQKIASFFNANIYGGRLFDEGSSAQSLEDIDEKESTVPRLNIKVMLTILKKLYGTADYYGFLDKKINNLINFTFADKK